MLERRNDLIGKITAAQYLAEHSTEKKITQLYCGTLNGYTLAYYKGRVKSPHRVGCRWLLDQDVAYAGDRAIRLFIKMYGKARIDSTLSAAEFVALCKNYMCLYPNDGKDMGTTRLHYMIDSIRNGYAFIKDHCKSCDQQFIVHRDDATRRVCRLCNTAH